MTDAVAPPEDGFPKGTPDERELYLRWLRYLRGAVMRKLAGSERGGGPLDAGGPR